MTFSFGTCLKMKLFGESHGPCVGVTIEGFPVGIKIKLDQIQTELDKRKPGQSLLTTQRKELDQLEVQSGLFENKSTGSPITMLVKNQDNISAHYDELKITPRPGHADFPAQVKYNGLNDHRGGGIFSGRMTAGIVMAGALAKQLPEMQGIQITTYIKQIGSIRSENNQGLTLEMEKLILKLRSEGDSVGGLIECQVTNLPVGLGEPFFDSLESVLSHALFSIPAVKGIEFGSGFACAEMKGSEHNDEFVVSNGKIITKTNHAGGILGGLSNGMPLIFRVAVKPTSSIAKIQNTVNLETLQEQKIQVKGRHDPCIAIRAVPVVENLTAFVIADFLLQAKISK